jgi:hypothetical protein
MVDHAMPQFKEFQLPTGETHWIPADLDLEIPRESSIAPELVHFLTFIPWRNDYLDLAPAAYRDFFSFTLPYLHVRTTDVHIATCLPYADELITVTPGVIDERVVHVAFILHDCGWSQMSEEEIAASLGVVGLALSADAAKPKARHAELGRELAKRILREYRFDPPLSEEQKKIIDTAIFYHDKPEELAAMADLPLSIQVVCDTDHLWSYTHANFWQDTVRKGVEPGDYLENLGSDLDGYFVTEPGKRKARRMLEERRGEVRAWEKWLSMVKM